MNDLYFKNGKAKKKYCKCLNKEYQKEVQKINGFINQDWICAGLRCPYYSIGCGKQNIEKFEKQIEK